MRGRIGKGRKWHILKSPHCAKVICSMWKITDARLKFLQMCFGLSQGATTSVNCICLPETVPPDYLSQLAPRGHPHWKRPLFHPQQLLSEGRRAGDLRVTSSKMAPRWLMQSIEICTTVSVSKRERAFTLYQRKLLCIGAKLMQKCRQKGSCFFLTPETGLRRGHRIDYMLWYALFNIQ